MYRAGIIAPANVQNDPQLIPGIATANTEPHRPKELDMFIDFSDRFNVMGNPKPPPTFVHPREWPDLLARAREFSLQNGGGSPKFAVLRLWSAPHFWPLMIRRNNRRIASFLDPLGRGWEFKFVPKDGYYSEWSTYNSLHQRLELFAPKFGDRVTHRGDVVLVMGEDARDLLKYVVAVTFVIQTKPWYREIDLWKSFINVDLEFLEGLDTYWLD